MGTRLTSKIHRWRWLIFLSNFGRNQLRSRVVTKLKSERNQTCDYSKTCRKNLTWEDVTWKETILKIGSFFQKTYSLRKTWFSTRTDFKWSWLTPLNLITKLYLRVTLLQEMATDYCDSFCAPDASAEDLHTILSIFPKQKPSNSFTTEGGKAGKVGPNEDESVGADLANGLSLTSWRQARNSIITVVCSLCESSTERQTKKCFMEQKNSIMLFVIVRSVQTILWASARSWAVKIIVGVIKFTWAVSDEAS